MNTMFTALTREQAFVLEISRQNPTQMTSEIFTAHSYFFSSSNCSTNFQCLSPGACLDNHVLNNALTS